MRNAKSKTESEKTSQSQSSQKVPATVHQERTVHKMQKASKPKATISLPQEVDSVKKAEDWEVKSPKVQKNKRTAWFLEANVLQ